MNVRPDASSVTSVQVVNGFCRLKETEMKMKVMTRLQNIAYLQTLLEKALAGRCRPQNTPLNDMKCEPQGSVIQGLDGL